MESFQAVCAIKGISCHPRKMSSPLLSSLTVNLERLFHSFLKHLTFLVFFHQNSSLFLSCCAHGCLLQLSDTQHACLTNSVFHLSVKYSTKIEFPLGSYMCCIECRIILWILDATILQHHELFNLFSLQSTKSDSSLELSADRYLSCTCTVQYFL